MIAQDDLKHRIRGQLWDLADEDEDGYPDDVFLDILSE